MRAVFGKKTREIRRKQSTAAWIATPGAFALRECRILDISTSGAKLSIPEGTDLTSRFHLTFSPSTRQGRACEVRWRKGSLIGVKFV